MTALVMVIRIITIIYEILHLLLLCVLNHERSSASLATYAQLLHSLFTSDEVVEACAGVWSLLADEFRLDLVLILGSVLHY